MRKLLTVLVVAAAAMSFSSAEAGVRTVKQSRLTFSALPCGYVCGYGNLAKGDDYACYDPYVPGSYADRTVRVPSRANYMIFTAAPEIDWDLFVCRSGKVVRYSATSYINTVSDVEKIGMWVKPGITYVLRAYNRRDFSDLTASLTFKRVSY